MSIFDPHELYVHHQKSTRKGQILQKHPVRRTGALTEDQIPQSIQVLRAYGYSVYPPLWRLPISLSAPFILTASSQTYTSMYFSFNTVLSALKTSFPALRTLISQNPIVNNSTFGISFQTMILFMKYGNINYKFYSNNVLNINTNFNIGVVSEDSVVSVQFGPSYASGYYLSYDKNFAQSTISGESIAQSRLESSDIPSTLCYHLVQNKWDEIKSNSGLTEDVKLFEASALSEGTLITGYSVNGYFSVNLNS